MTEHKTRYLYLHYARVANNTVESDEHRNTARKLAQRLGVLVDVFIEDQDAEDHKGTRRESRHG